MPRRSPRLIVAAVLILATAGASWWGWTPARSAIKVSQSDLPADICIVAPALSYDPTSGLALHDPRPVPPEARCPVCGMYPSRFPNWAAQVIYRDGAVHFFDSPASLLVYLRDPARFSNYRSEDVLASYVNDVPANRWTPAGDANYVHGSDVLGPMRIGNLPAFANRIEAERFVDERGGVVLALHEIDADVLDTLVTNVHRHR